MSRDIDFVPNSFMDIGREAVKNLRARGWTTNDVIPNFSRLIDAVTSDTPSRGSQAVAWGVFLGGGVVYDLIKVSAVTGVEMSRIALDRSRQKRTPVSA